VLLRRDFMILIKVKRISVSRDEKPFSIVICSLSTTLASLSENYL